MRTPLFRSLKRLQGLVGYGLGLSLSLLVWATASGFGYSYVLGWQGIGVDAMTHFYDLDLSWKAAQFLESGQDPYTDGSYNEREVLANYPPLMLQLIDSYCGLFGTIDIAGWVLAMAILTLIGGLAYSTTLGGGWLLGMGMGFGGGALALERGNSDLLLVPIVMGLSYIPMMIPKRRFFSGAVVAALTLLGLSLKLFPVLASGVAMALPKPKERYWVLAIVTIGALTYYYTHVELVEMLLANTGLSSKNSYGFVATAAAFPIRGVSWGILKPVFYLTITGVGLFFSGLLWQRETRIVQNEPSYTYSLALAGISLFVGTYLIGNSFNYRLIFGLLALPYVVASYSKTGFFICFCYTLFSAWPAVENNIFWYIAWNARNEMLISLIRQILGLGLASLGLGWIMREVWEKLLKAHTFVA